MILMLLSFQLWQTVIRTIMNQMLHWLQVQQQVRIPKMFLPLSRRIKGDGNCYFRPVSFYLCGEEDYYIDIHKAVCDFISTFDDDLKPFMKKGKGKEYLLKSKMRDNGKWATETEILATAKILHWDIFTFHNFQRLRYPYKNELSPDALYLDNQSGLHFDAVLWP